MDDLEQFEAAARPRALACGLTEAEIREATGPLADSDALRATARVGGALLLLGPPGTGKTLAATRWLLEPLYDLARWSPGLGVSMAWGMRRASEPRLLWRTAKSLSRVQQYDTAAVEPLFTAERLVVDDLGQEYLDKSGFLSALIDEIVSERHRRRVPTVLTSNVTAEEFLARYGRRVVDRIAASGGMVACDGESMRRRAPLNCPIAPLVTGDMLAARINDAAAKAAGDAEIRRRLFESKELEWRGDESPARASVPLPPIKSPPRATMTDAELEARKTQIARDLADWRARNPEPTT